MKKIIRTEVRDGLTTGGILLAAFATGFVISGIFPGESVIPMIFVLAVFLTSLFTQGYFWGIFSAVLSVFGVNFAFTAPFFAFDFQVVENVVSAVVMGIVTVATCTLTQKIKRHKMIKADFDREKIRSNLLRAVSHDLRTPLTGIYGASSTIADHYQALTDQQKIQMLRGIQEDAQWLISMVENLLSITKIGNENVEITKISVVVEELVGAATAKFRKRYPQQRVELQIPDEFITISADPILIQQVLVNFLENAAQHAEGMTRLELRVSRRGNHVLFEILDDGVGIPEKQIPYLFSGNIPALEKDVDNRRSGMGIGLSVCATIIRAHGGKIGVRKRNSGGTCFWFLLETEEKDES